MAPPSMQEMRRHFDESPALVALLRARGKDEPVGLGEASLSARSIYAPALTSSRGAANA